MARAAQHKESMKLTGGGQALRQVCVLFPSTTQSNGAIRINETALFSTNGAFLAARVSVGTCAPYTKPYTLNLEP